MSWIFDLIMSILKAIPILAKYFPVKTVEEKVEAGQAAIHDQIKKEEETGRPS